MEKKYFLGIDIGSTTFKTVLLTADGKVKHTLYQRTKPLPDAKLSCSGQCSSCGACNLGSVSKTVDDFLATAGTTKEEVACTIVTGSQIVDELKKFIDYDFFVSEVSAHVAGALHYYPNSKAILDVGGQDSKAIVYDENMEMWVSKMSGICAAGTGAFLDSVAAKLNVPVEDMADKVNYDSDLEVSSICAVLSATSVNKFKNRYPLGDVIAAACRAQASTVMSGVGELFFNHTGDIVFQGGVASNRAVSYYLHEITDCKIVIPEFHQVMGALGAACLARKLVGLKKQTIGVPEIHKALNAIDNTRLSKEFTKLKEKLFPKIKVGINEIHEMIDHIGDAQLAREASSFVEKVIQKKPFDIKKITKASAMRTTFTRKEFFSRGNEPLVWRNLFYPPEVLNALGVKMLTLETYAALRGHGKKRLRKLFDKAAFKGFAAETCSFLRVLEGDDRLPKPDFSVTTTEPCKQGERIFADLIRTYDAEDKYFTLHTPFHHDENSVEHIANGLEESVHQMEKKLGLKLEDGKLEEACELSNQAREIAIKSTELRFTSPPLMRGSEAAMYANVFSQLWGKKDMIDLQKVLYDELLERKEIVEKNQNIEDTHRLLWLHLPPFYNSRLMDYVELTMGAPIVFEEVNFTDWTPLNPNDPYRSLAKKILTVGFLDPELRVKHICDVAVHAKLTGCLLYNHGFGRCAMSDASFIKHLREKLQEVKIPLLVLDGDCLDESTDPCSTFTKVSSYIESLNRKKFGNIFGK